MIKSSPRDLVHALTPTCARALGTAVVRCVNTHHREATIEHFLLALLDDRSSDVSMLVALHGLEPSTVQSALEQACAALPPGEAERPTFSVPLLQLFDDTLHDVAIPAGRASVRSGDLLGKLFRDPSRYAADALAARLQGLPGRTALTAVPLGDLARETRESADLDGGSPHAPVSPLDEGTSAGPHADWSAPAQAARRPRAVVIHRVLEGEDLLSIARRYALDVEDIAFANHVELTGSLPVGSTLELRVLSELVWSTGAGHAPN